MGIVFGQTLYLLYKSLKRLPNLSNFTFLVSVVTIYCILSIISGNVSLFNIVFSIFGTILSVYLILYMDYKTGHWKGWYRKKIKEMIHNGMGEQTKT